MTTGSHSDSLDTARIRAVLFERKRLILLMTGLTTLLALLYVLFMPRWYLATATIMPDFEINQGSPFGQIGGLVEGLGLGNVGSVDHSALYRSILESRALIYPLLQHSFLNPENSQRRTILDKFPLEENEIPAARVQRVHDLFLRRLNVIKDLRTNVVSVELEWTTNWMAAAVVNFLVEELDTFIRARTTQKATQNREFIEGQVQVTLDSLVMAEDNLLRHRQNNRRIENSPLLVQERERLERNRHIQEQAYLLLRQELQVSRLEEVKNERVLNVLDYAETPERPQGPHPLLLLFAGIVGGAFIGSVWALILAQRPGQQ